MKDILIFGIGIIIAAILYTFASFFSITQNKHPTNTNEWVKIIGVAILFAAVEYMFKIPAYMSGKKHLDPSTIHIIWLVLAFIATNLYQIFFMKKEVSMMTWIIGGLVTVQLVYLVYHERSS